MRLAILIILITGAFGTVAQDFPREEVDLGQLVNDQLSFQDENVDYENLYENYAQLFANPINLNKASAEQLRLPGILTEQQITDILEYIKSQGKLLSVYELQAIPSLDENTLMKLSPFITVDKDRQSLDRNFIERIKDADFYFLTRYERKLTLTDEYHSENPETKFQGTADKLYHKVRATSLNDFSFGITAEKDAGEKIEWSNQTNKYGYDYLSYHAQIANKKAIRNLIIGDYQFQFGQGLLLGSGFGFGKGAETITVLRKSNIGFLPYTSVNESGFMRGAASTINIKKNLYLSAFYSNTNRDATVQGLDDSLTFSSLITTGLHRNVNELAKRKVINEINYGAIAEYKNARTEIGLITNQIIFDIPTVKKPTPYNQFAFKGDENINASLYVNHNFQNASFFSEAGKSLNGGYGVVAGLLLSLNKNLDAGMLFRKYDKNFYTFYSNALSENTIPQNETGMYWGFKYKFLKRYTLSSYVDLFEFPWLKFQTYQPSKGKEIFTRLQYQPSKKSLLYIQWRREEKYKNGTETLSRYLLHKTIKHNAALASEFYATPQVRLKSRVQWSNVNSGSSQTSGLAILQDISIRIKKLKLTGRYAIFDIDDFTNRQYAYENDMLMAFSFPAYQGTGTRIYLMAEYKITRHVSWWIRYSQTRSVVNDEPLSTMGEVKSQVMLRW